MNQTFVEFAVRDYNKPVGVATYRASKGYPLLVMKRACKVNPFIGKKRWNRFTNEFPGCFVSIAVAERTNPEGK